MEKKEIKCVIFGNLVELKGTEIQKKKNGALVPFILMSEFPCIVVPIFSSMEVCWRSSSAGAQIYS